MSASPAPALAQALALIYKKPDHRHYLSTEDDAFNDGVEAAERVVEAWAATHRDPNEELAFKGLSDALTNGAAGTWEELFDAAARLRSAETRPQWEDAAYCSAQLRHAYQQLVTPGAVSNQRKFADGLLSPIIQRLERMAAPALPGETPAPLICKCDHGLHQHELLKNQGRGRCLISTCLCAMFRSWPGETPAEPPQLGETGDWYNDAAKAAAQARRDADVLAPPAVAPVARTQDEEDRPGMNDWSDWQGVPMCPRCGEPVTDTLEDFIPAGVCIQDCGECGCTVTVVAEISSRFRVRDGLWNKPPSRDREEPR